MNRWLLLLLAFFVVDHPLSSNAFSRQPTTHLISRPRYQRTIATMRHLHQRDRYETRSNSKNKFRRRKRRYPSSKRQRPRFNPSPEYQRALNSLLEERNTNTTTIDVSRLTRPEQVHLIQELERADRYSTILELVSSCTRQERALLETAVVALWRSTEYRSSALELLSAMNTTLSSKTLSSLFDSVSDASDAALLMERLLESNHNPTIQVWNAALLACRRSNNWQVSLSILRDMKRHGIHPDEYSYGHVLMTCAQSGQVKICMSLLQEVQRQRDRSISQSPHVYGAALQACAFSSGDNLQHARTILHYMNDGHVEINAIHVTSLLKTCANAGRDDLALDLIRSFQQKKPFSYKNITIPPVDVDMIMVNTVLLACSKAGNEEGAITILEQVKRGEFGEDVEADVVSYNTVLSACSDPVLAKALVKEVRCDIDGLMCS